MSNRSTGNAVEQEFCKLLAKRGYWVHNMAQNSAGQPADVIAVKQGCAFLIDVKNCATDKGLALSRIEQNQLSAMTKWYECGNGEAWFALRFKGSFYMVSISDLLHYKLRNAHLSGDRIVNYCLPVEKWIEFFEEIVREGMENE